MGSLNLPNLITLFRILASFVFLYYGLKKDWEVAFPIFVIAAATDMIDGTIARVLRQRTQLGGFLDPTADKLLMFFSFLTLTLSGYLPLALTLAVFGRDLLISAGLVLLKVKRVPIVYRPTYLSKLTTLFQILTVFGALLMTQELSRLRATFYGRILLGGETFALVLGLTALLTVVTAVQYLRIGRDLLKHAKAETHRQ
jgi:cardiolipin synthase